MNNLQRRLNKYRTSLKRLPMKVQTITWRMKRSFSGGPASRIAFRIDGGMGDHIIAARFIRDWVSAVPGHSFDIYCKRPAVMSWLARDIPGCNLVGEKKMDLKILRGTYDYIFNLFTFVSIAHERPSSITRKDRRLQEMVRKVRKACQPIHHHIHMHPLLDGYLGQYVSLKGSRRHQYLHHMAGLAYGGDALDIETDEAILARLGLEPGSYITVSNGYDELIEMDSSGLNTKVFPYFEALAARLKKDLPHLKLVQIGTQTSTPIDCVDIDLIGKTSLKEVAAILQHSVLHVDNEGGLVHLAAALGTRSCVVFGPTLATYFGYEDNLNIEPRACGSCWWMEPTWMTRCVKGHAKPVCMYTHSAENIADRIVAELALGGRGKVIPLRFEDAGNPASLSAPSTQIDFAQK